MILNRVELTVIDWSSTQFDHSGYRNMHAFTSRAATFTKFGKRYHK